MYALGLGTQFPDLVDQPLAWHLAVLPSGRSLAHSLFALGVVVGALWFAFDAPERRRLTAAFGVGWASHLVGDGVFAVLRGSWGHLGYLLWPVTSYPAEPGGRSILAFLCTSNSRRGCGWESRWPASRSASGCSTARRASPTCPGPRTRPRRRGVDVGVDSAFRDRSHGRET